MNYETPITADDGDALAGDTLSAGSGLRSVSRRTIILSVIGLIFLVAAAFYLLRVGEAPSVAAGGDTDQSPSITVIEPGRTTVQGEIVATGTIAARRSMPVGVVGEGGRVVAVPVDAGQWVKAGQVLAVIDRSVQNEQALSSDAQVQVAQANARLAQSNLERALKLVDRGFVSAADVDRLTATRDAAAAQVKVARAQLGELRARNARLSIIAPAEGLVLERNVEPGQVVSPSSGALFTIAKGGQMELLAQLGETELAKISTGALAKVTPAGTNKAYTGQVWQIAPTINMQNRQGTARIALSYADGLRPGGFATAKLLSGTVVAPILPESAVLSDSKGSYVYIADKDNKVVHQPVKTGMTTDKGVVITDGLTGAERVVLRAGEFLNPGETIKPVKAGS